MIQFLDFRTQMADGDRGDFVCRIGFALRLGRTVVFLSYRNPVRPCDYFMLRHVLPDFRRVRLGRRHFGKMVAP